MDKDDKNKQQKAFFKDLNGIINKYVLGTGKVGIGASWLLPLEGKLEQEEIGNISCNKNRGRKVVERMEDKLFDKKYYYRLSISMEEFYETSY